MAMGTRRRRGAVLMMVAILAGCATAPASEGFYAPERAELVGAPGSLIRSESLTGAPRGARAWRLLYRSTGLKGEPIAVSALAIVPLGPPPGEGRPVVAWAHPTTGTATSCAPSQDSTRFSRIQGLDDMIARGFAVVATDYPGLGTPGPHPYLVGISEGRAVLDSVRALRALPGSGAGTRFIAWGHSQGGHAALFAGDLAKGYAPDLRAVGIATAAPATDLVALFAGEPRGAGGRALTSLTLESWARVYGAPIGDVVDPAARATSAALSEICLASVTDVVRRSVTGRALDDAFLTVPDLTRVPPWRDLFARNSTAPLPRDLPLYLAQGADDGTVPPQVNMAYARKVCAGGGRVQFDLMPGEGHVFIGARAAPRAVEWMAGRFAGTPAPSTCGAI